MSCSNAKMCGVNTCVGTPRAMPGTLHTYDARRTMRLHFPCRGRADGRFSMDSAEVRVCVCVCVRGGGGGNDTTRNTGRSGRQNAATRRNMRREERLTVQGPVKKPQPDGTLHRGRGAT